MHEKLPSHAQGAVLWGLSVVTVLAIVAPATARAAETFDHDHRAWDALLKAHVRGGFVEYGKLQARSEASLDAYLGTLESVSKSQHQGWTRNQKLAFWINAYNAYTVRLILNHYPLTSIRRIGFLPMAAFRKEFIPLEEIWGEPMSLNDIEHEVLRPRFQEPRIHFAVVCASKSCPILRSEAFRAASLDHQLDAAARGFLGDQGKNFFDPDSQTLHLSSIFDWFEKDFEQAAGSVPEFVAQYMDNVPAKTKSLEIEHLDYDWSLNGR